MKEIKREHIQYLVDLLVQREQAFRTTLPWEIVRETVEEEREIQYELRALLVELTVPEKNEVGI